MFMVIFSYFIFPAFIEVLSQDIVSRYKYAPPCYDRTLVADFENSSEYLYTIWSRIVMYQQLSLSNPELFRDKYDLLHTLYWGLLREITSPIVDTILPVKYCDEL